MLASCPICATSEQVSCSECRQLLKAIRRRRDRPHKSAATTTMRRAALLLALLFHGGWSVDTDGCESDADCAVGQWCDTTAQFCPLGQPGIPDPNVTGLLPPPTWLANSTDTGGDVPSERYRSEESPKNAVVAAVAYPFKAAAGLFMPAPPTPQSDGDISPTFTSRLPRPPIARNDHGLGSTWSGDYS